jgi:hypothetical protein
MYKRDVAVVILSFLALFLCLQHEGSFSFNKAWCVGRPCFCTAGVICSIPPTEPEPKTTTCRALHAMIHVISTSTSLCNGAADAANRVDQAADSLQTTATTSSRDGALPATRSLPPRQYKGLPCVGAGIMQRFMIPQSWICCRTSLRISHHQ